jgi:hypothetical protein
MATIYFLAVGVMRKDVEDEMWKMWKMGNFRPFISIFCLLSPVLEIDRMFS